MLQARVGPAPWPAMWHSLRMSVQSVLSAEHRGCRGEEDAGCHVGEGACRRCIDEFGCSNFEECCEPFGGAGAALLDLQGRCADRVADVEALGVCVCCGEGRPSVAGGRCLACRRVDCTTCNNGASTLCLVLNDWIGLFDEELCLHCLPLA